jgi:hypothetical protein
MPDRNTDPLKEILTRSRRTETRLTTLMIHMGLDAQGQKPVFQDNRAYGEAIDKRSAMQLPSIDCSMKSMLAAVPEGFRGMIDVLIGTDHVTTLVVRDRT